MVIFFVRKCIISDGLINGAGLMLSKVFVRVDLRKLILLLSAVVAIATLANALYSAYKVQKQQLIDSTIEANRVYAAKLSDSIEQFLYAAQQQVSYSARILGAKGYDHELAALEAERLRQQTDSFNSVTMVDADGYVVAVSPETIKIKGARLESPGAIEALRERRPLISKPYVSAAGNLVVIVSSPVFSESGRYLGYVGGTIYLRQKSILHNLIGVHFYRDESYIYIVDSERVIIYHPDQDRIGETVGVMLLLIKLSVARMGVQLLLTLLELKCSLVTHLLNLLGGGRFSTDL